jgi:hypothetical protein
MQLSMEGIPLEHFSPSRDAASAIKTAIELDEITDPRSGSD